MPNRVEVAVGVFADIPLELEAEGGEKLQAHIDAGRRAALAEGAQPLPTEAPKKDDPPANGKTETKSSGKGGAKKE